MEKETLEEYVDILEIFINHHNSGRKTLLTPKEIRDGFGVEKKSDPQYEQKKRSLDRCMEFYSLIKLITIQTDTTDNEINRLVRLKKDRWTPLNERKQLDPYIDFIKTQRKSTLTTNICDLYNTVYRLRKTIEVWIDDNKDEVDEKLIQQLPKPINEYSTDKDGFYVVNPKLKFKKVEKTPLKFEFNGDKFKNIVIDVNKDFKDSDGKKRNLSKDTVIIDSKNITLVDMDDTSVRAEDCLYKLTQSNNCNSNPINYVIPSNDKIDLFVDFIDRLIDRKINDDGTYDYDISTHPIVSTVIQSNAFGLETDFVCKTLGKLLIERQNTINTQNNRVIYTLPLLIEIIGSNNKIDIEFENYGNNIKLQNTQINQITIKENSFDIIFDNFISMNQSDILQIKSITNSDINGLNDDYEKLKELVNGLDEKYKLTFRNILMLFSYDDVFEF